MLPLSNQDNSPRVKITASVVNQIIGWLRLIFSDRNSVNLLLFLSLNLSFAVVELIFGVWTNSLGLISDSFHMFFDSTGLIMGLVASVITKWRANDKYSFGYVRAEVLAGLVNGLFLIFVAFFVLCEAVERAIVPPEVKHERLLLISVLGLLINLIGIYAFHQTHGESHGQSHINMNSGHLHGSGHFHRQTNEIHGNTHIIKGVFLHILADTLGSLGVIISSLLVQNFGYLRADPVCSIFIAVLIALSVTPLIKDSFYILMQRQPIALDNVLPECYEKVMHLPGVYSIQEPHFWTLCSGYYVGGLKLEVSKGVDPTYITNQTKMIFFAVGVRQIYIQIDYATV